MNMKTQNQIQHTPGVAFSANDAATQPGATPQGSESATNTAPPQEAAPVSRTPGLLNRRSFCAAAVATVAAAPLDIFGSSTTTEVMKDEVLKEKIRRARLSGPPSVTSNATVAEMDAQGKMVVLLKGTNEWLCMPGNENVVGDVPMALDPMGMQWYMDVRAKKPKPTNTAPGLIYMLCGATQHSYTNPFDTTSPPIPVGPHWMILWPFDAATSGLPTVMRDGGTMIMFAGTPYAHLHICGSPLDGKEYQPGDRGMWTMVTRYGQP
jgi:hypothetical protein